MDGGWRLRISQFSAALWWGSITAVCGLMVPMLFLTLTTPGLAGYIAPRLFEAQNWLGLGCGVVLLLLLKREAAGGLGASRAVLGFTTLGMMLALLIQFGVAPRIIARENLALWHNLGSAMFVLQWLCAGAVLWRLTAPGARD